LEQINLAAVMFTDIVGYTSLVENDEELALKLLDEHRKIVRPLISAHNGKEVKTMGDAFLVEFSSAVEAAKCAIEIQRSLFKFNSKRSPEQRVLLRIGIHLGDVVHSNNDVYGEAVNFASRLQSISEPGGVCVSRQFYESVRSKMRELEFKNLGTRKLKNIVDPVELFQIIIPQVEESMSSRDNEPDLQQPRNRIAILPFVNISPDNSDEFFADGLTEELISRLSQAKDLRVIARTSAMNYKNNKEKKIKDIGRELGAGTIIEGSVRKAGNKVRVSVQVVNAGNEEHMWSSTYDRNLDDIFEIQSDIASKVVESFSSNLAPLIRGEKHGEERETQNVTAYTYFLRARHLLHNENLSSVNQAFELFSRAIQEDPSFARAYVGRAECYLYLTGYAQLPFSEGSKKAEAECIKAIELDPELAEAHAQLSRVKYQLDEFDASKAEAKKAVELNPSHSDAYHALGHLAMIRREAAEGVRLFETAHKLDPLKEHTVEMLGESYVFAGREEEAIKLWESTMQLFPETAYAGLIEYYMMKGDNVKAGESLEKLRSVAVGNLSYIVGLEGRIAALKGEREKALDCIAKIEHSSGGDTVAVNYVGFIYYALGDMDKFFEYMNRSIDNHSLPGQMLRNSPAFANARMDPRYRKLLEREGLDKSFFSN
jgi:adenylate cyclase